MKVGSVFAGIGGFDLAFERAGGRIIWNCEIDAKCRSVLRHHWPGTPRFKDVKTVTGAGLGAAGLRPDCLVGGFPCQDVSVAGARAGLAGERSGLFFEFARLLDEIRPRWCVVENVPGLLSSHKGKDFGTVLGILADLGYVGAWRVLDAQYFGVAQRRRRVFIVGCLGDRARAAEVLLESEGGGGDPPARRTTGADVAGTLGGGSGSRGWCDDLDRATFVPATAPSVISQYHKGTDSDATDTLLPVAFHMTQDPITGDVAPALGGVKPTTGYSTVGVLGPTSHTVPAHAGRGVQEDDTGRGIPVVNAVAYRKATKAHHAEDWERWEEAERIDAMAASGATTAATAVVAQLAVRRLTPLECLRLQGFPDDWLDGLGLADSVKYRMCGNAVAVPVVEWVAQRILEIDEQS